MCTFKGSGNVKQNAKRLYYFSPKRGGKTPLLGPCEGERFWRQGGGRAFREQNLVSAGFWCCWGGGPLFPLGRGGAVAGDCLWPLGQPQQKMPPGLPSYWLLDPGKSRGFRRPAQKARAPSPQTQSLQRDSDARDDLNQVGRPCRQRDDHDQIPGKDKIFGLDNCSSCPKERTL